MTADPTSAQQAADTTPRIAAVVLAAGAGTRMGEPKGLLRTPAGEPWLARAVDLASGAGCSPVFAAVGARGPEVSALLPASSSAQVVVAEEWANGMAESLRAGLAAAVASDCTACLILLVDMPDLPATVLQRVLEPGVNGGEVTADTLRQAVYHGQPGHPVLVGRSHWAALVRDLSGDRGARAYLAAHGVDEVECSDVYDGHDIDTPSGA
jgi:CTP:molybdopterin cytidylyltransferase MocA